MTTGASNAANAGAFPTGLLSGPDSTSAPPNESESFKPQASAILGRFNLLGICVSIGDRCGQRTAFNKERHFSQYPVE